jgi:hypothetical protein
MGSRLRRSYFLDIATETSERRAGASRRPQRKGLRVDAHGRRRTKIRRSLRAVLLLPILVIAAGAATYSSPAPAAGPNPKIEQKVIDEVNANGKATFWVILKEKADLSKVSKIGNWNERGRLVV